jgi:hypothetical protein
MKNKKYHKGYGKLVVEITVLYRLNLSYIGRRLPLVGLILSLCTILMFDFGTVSTL